MEEREEIELQGFQGYPALSARQWISRIMPDFVHHVYVSECIDGATNLEQWI